MDIIFNDGLKAKSQNVTVVPSTTHPPLKSLKTIGLSDDKSYTFLINTKQYPIELFNKDVWERKLSNKNHDQLIVIGVKLLSLGKMVLLCPPTVEVNRKETLKVNLDNYFDNKSINLANLKQQAKSCRILEYPYIQQLDLATETKST